MTAMGQPTVALAKSIHRLRASVNEARVVWGKHSQKTLALESDLRAKMNQARNLFRAPTHN